MIKVFIADDQQLILDEMKCIIDWESYGFTITGEANEGLSSYEKISMLKSDIVFTDIVMPGLNGLELLEKLKHCHPAIEVVILTGHADFAYAKASLKHGAFDYLLKPLGTEELLDTLERFKEKYAVLHDLDENNGTAVKALPSDVQGNSTLNLFLRYIRENYSKTLNLYEIANLFHFNESYISQLFKKDLGISFSEYVTRFRMDMAEKLLKGNAAAIKSIHSEVGINDYYYFIKLFKKYKGITPHQMKLKSNYKADRLSGEPPPLI